ncbi:bc transporter [Diaporthe amygdali]|uniref:bc transporter n=1 Tax=Phomopsis amygdali TaxID=1214568 RepID=UPI0022FDF444|nr:bc transporter [Diaporthe amygdali]KAJ0120416.1 bc transporter [Diaporthe amygdali]
MLTHLQILRGASAITFLFEIPLFVLAASNGLRTSWKIASVCCQAARHLAIILLILTGVTQKLATRQQLDVEESEPFVQAQSGTGQTGYGSVPFHGDTDSEFSSQDTTGNCGYDSGSDDDNDDDDDDAASIKRRRAKRLQETGGWLGYLKDFSLFLPYIIPKKDRKVQFSILLCIICLAGRRALNVLIPAQLGIVTNLVIDKQAPYGALFVWLLLVLINDDAGLGLVEDIAKIPVKQFSYRQITNVAFNHVMSLSMEFHSERDSAEIMKAIEQGESLANLLETAIIDILPTILDLFVAFWMLYIKFNIYVGLTMLIAAGAFMSMEIYTSSTNIENRRVSSKAEREEARVLHQAIQGWQTVSYFNMFSFEKRRFGRAVDLQLEASRRYAVRDALVQAMLELLAPITFFTLSSLILYDIYNGCATPGDFVFFIQYWESLIWPMKFLSHNYRYLMTDLVDAERLLKLLQTKSTILDKDDAVELCSVKGHVAFENVGFSYDPRKPTIRDLSISVAPGQTIALVGETGAGKSSTMKLLLRFFDVTSGRITIDGHDIRDVTIGSLREALGVVPQDPLLFNATIKENLLYARPTATNEEIFEACRAASIHDRILTFAEGYESRVGEQGVKLSGGEIQRLAIARVFLKDPPILILDEATSAVDTVTEASIQEALNKLRNGRTALIIAHRLSTVVHADKIIVLHDGEVAEGGTHQELLAQGGRYNDLWMRQVGDVR